MTLTVEPTQSTASWSESWGPAPRFITPRTEARPTFGPQVRKIARLLGLKSLPHQEYIWDVALEVQSEEAGDPNPGFWAYSTVDDTEPRRGGKTVKVQPVVIHRAEMIERGQIAMTAQTGIAASKRWKDLADRIEESYLADRVTRRNTVGRETLTWRKTRATLGPFSPKADSGHGDEYDLILADEIWKWDAQRGADIDQAIRPMALTNNMQFWRYSAAGTPESAYYNAMRATGRETVEAGITLGRFYAEWSVPAEVGGVRVEDLPDDVLISLIIAHHPRAYDLEERMFREFLEQELRTAQAPQGEGRHGFLRAYGNHTAQDFARTAIVAPAILTDGLTRNDIPQGQDIGVGLGFDLDPDGRQACVTAAWRNPDTGRGHLQVLRCDLGISWVAEYIAGVYERQTNRIPVVGVNDTSVTRNVADQLAGAGIPLERITTIKDYAAACDRWYQETTDANVAMRLQHQGHPEYLAAIADARWAAVNGGGRKLMGGEVPITALTSGVAALWTFDHMPEPEPDLGPFRIL